ncbi:MAG: ADP-ribose pyrophosphatase [Chloroflexi bacterium]|nr:ADP-ribose pyrophosphatase [Chloroflexota bacterium]
MVNREKLLDSRYAYQGQRINLRVDGIELPSGKKTTREIVEHSNCVAIVAVDAAENVTLIRQHRSAIGQNLLEIPAGKIEPGESPLACAHRELREETGYLAGKVEALGGFYASPGYSTEYLYLYLATELEPVLEAPDADEIMDVVRVPLASIPERIASGEIRDAKTLVGLLYVERVAELVWR